MARVFVHLTDADTDSDTYIDTDVIKVVFPTVDGKTLLVTDVSQLPLLVTEAPSEVMDRMYLAMKMGEP